jgi:hypothetical protein
MSNAEIHQTKQNLHLLVSLSRQIYTIKQKKALFISSLNPSARFPGKIIISPPVTVIAIVS